MINKTDLDEGMNRKFKKGYDDVNKKSEKIISKSKSA